MKNRKRFSLSRAGEPELHVVGPLEPEPLKKNSGAGAAKNIKLLYRLLEDQTGSFVRKKVFCQTKPIVKSRSRMFWPLGAGAAKKISGSPSHV